MLYEDRVFNFQRKDRAKNWWVWGEDHCLNVPAGLEDRISSIRFSGAPDDWKYDTISFYSDRAFTGSDKRYLYIFFKFIIQVRVIHLQLQAQV